MGRVYEMQNSSSSFTCEYQKAWILFPWRHSQVGARRLFLFYFLSTSLLTTAFCLPLSTVVKKAICLIFTSKSFEVAGLLLPNVKPMKSTAGVPGSTDFRLLHTMSSEPLKAVLPPNSSTSWEHHFLYGANCKEKILGGGRREETFPVPYLMFYLSDKHANNCPKHNLILLVVPENQPSV